MFCDLWGHKESDRTERLNWLTDWRNPSPKYFISLYWHLPSNIKNNINYSIPIDLKENLSLLTCYGLALYIHTKKKFCVSSFGLIILGNITFKITVSQLMFYCLIQFSSILPFSLATYSFSYRHSLVVLVIKNPPPHAGDVRDIGSILGQEAPLKEGMATHFSILAWRIPWTEEPGRLQSIGLCRVWHD